MNRATPAAVRRSSGSPSFASLAGPPRILPTFLPLALTLTLLMACAIPSALLAGPARAAASDALQGAVRQVSQRNAKSIVVVEGALPMNEWEFRARQVVGGSGATRGPDSAAARTPLATGVVLDRTGLIAAASSKLPNCRAYGVRTADGRSLNAHWVGYDEASGIALLRAPGAGPVALPAPDAAVLSGEAWVAILSRTPSNQLMASVGTALRSSSSRGSLGSTAAPAAAGGVMVDGEGRWMGLVSAGQSLSFGRFSETTDQGMPVLAHAWTREEVLRVTGDVARGSVADRGYLGVRVEPTAGADSAARGLSSTLRVAQVVQGSPAARGGLKPGDLITTFNQRAISGVDDFADRVARTSPGTRVFVGVQHGASVTDREMLVAAVPPAAVAADTLSVRDVFRSQLRWFQDQAASLGRRLTHR